MSKIEENVKGVIWRETVASLIASNLNRFFTIKCLHSQFYFEEYCMLNLRLCVLITVTIINALKHAFFLESRRPLEGSWEAV